MLVASTRAVTLVSKGYGSSAAEQHQQQQCRDLAAHGDLEQQQTQNNSTNVIKFVICGCSDQSCGACVGAA